MTDARQRFKQIRDLTSVSLDTAKQLADEKLLRWGFRLPKGDGAFGSLPQHVYMDFVLRVAASLSIPAEREGLVLTPKSAQGEAVTPVNGSEKT